MSVMINLNKIYNLKFMAYRKYIRKPRYKRKKYFKKKRSFFRRKKYLKRVKVSSRLKYKILKVIKPEVKCLRMYVGVNVHDLHPNDINGEITCLFPVIAPGTASN